VLVAPEAVIVIGELTVPALNPVVLTLTVRDPFPVPDDGLTLSQAAFSVALQLSVPEPVLVMVIVWLAGFVPPWTPVNDKFVVLKPMVGVGAAVTVSVTETVCGVFVAPVALIVIIALCVPTARPVLFTLAAKDPPFVPEAEFVPFKLNQAAFETAFQLSVPPPPLVIVTV
jgi:hypothetical protein